MASSNQDGGNMLVSVWCSVPSPGPAFDYKMVGTCWSVIGIKLFCKTIEQA